MKNMLKPVLHLSLNLKRMLLFAWKMDSNLVLRYYGAAIISSLLYLAGMFILAYLIDLLIAESSPATTTVPLIIVAVLASRYLINVLRGITNWILYLSYYDYLFRYKLQNYISHALYKKLSSLDVAHLEDPKTQDLISKTKDTMLWRPTDMLRQFSYFISGIVSFIAAFIFLLPYGFWIPFAVSFASIPLLILRTKLGDIQWSIYGSGAPEVKKLWYFIWLLSTPTAIREMKIFRSSSKLLDKFKNIQDYLFKLNKKPLDDYMKIQALPAIFEAIVIFLVAYLQLPDVLGGLITIGSFTLLINFIDNLNYQASGAVLNFGEMYNHSLYADHFFDVLSLPAIIKDPANPHIFDKFEPPRIEFRDVSFAYPNGTKVLDRISFFIEPGENVAIVGENGAGKSTIIKLLCRFYDVTEGEILINGINIKQLKLDNWYQFLGTLFQDFVQYHFSVKENILLGNPDRQDNDAVIEAAKRSGADDFINKLPKQYETILGREFEEGEELSIGQWQKLAIARAFYEEAPVLILDEPTSAIDAEAEYEIFSNLEKTYKNKTLILVSHRFSTVRNANKIIVINRGQITECGSHQALLKLNGKYAKMFKTQAKGYA